MYYIIYPLFYLLSLLPWWLMYLIADGLYVIVYYFLGYRKKVVFHNLEISFPEKSAKERERIAKDFYHNFIDTIVETIKMISISNRTLNKRMGANIEVLNALYDSGKNVQLMAGHFFNWEYLNRWLPLHSKFPFVGVYQPMSNKTMDRILYNMRAINGTILIPTKHFKNQFHHYVRDRYALGLAADQNPPSDLKAHWVPFFNRLTPFIPGPEKGAKMNDTHVVFCHFYKVKRGHYQIHFELITEEPRSFKNGELTRLFAQKVEAAIRLKPANYLWSHRRWKFTYDAQKHAHLVVEPSKS